MTEDLEPADAPTEAMTPQNVSMTEVSAMLVRFDELEQEISGRADPTEYGAFLGQCALAVIKNEPDSRLLATALADIIRRGRITPAVCGFIAVVTEAARAGRMN